MEAGDDGKAEVERMQRAGGEVDLGDAVGHAVGEADQGAAVVVGDEEGLGREGRVADADGEVVELGGGEVEGEEVGAAGGGVLLALGEEDEAVAVVRPGGAMRGLGEPGDGLLFGGVLGGDDPAGGAGAEVAQPGVGEDEEAVGVLGPGDGVDVGEGGDVGLLPGLGVEQIEVVLEVLMLDPDGVFFVGDVLGAGGGFGVGGDDGDAAAVGRDGVGDDVDGGGGLRGGGGALELDRCGLAATERETVEAGLLVATGEEEDGAVVGEILGAGLAGGVGGVEGELAIGRAVGAEQPEVLLAAVGGAVLQGDDDVLEVGRELRIRDAAQLAQVFVGGEVLLRGERGRCKQKQPRDKVAIHLDLLSLFPVRLLVSRALFLAAELRSWVMAR